ncbi:bifunctional phosphoribosyl-AMP cyclohydrolase/phosphoribosyl-ATP diphosphatase HisIE [Lederbergia citrea]|uniref:Histidine biosynthesis bifunctional protein HisIE n=1 Tax=Lederbergia citrea TaxID=2833581 RepID=A0A942UPR5_9BACI|nr:bifunctional phosphoribosyl-AMP cyclohydrolase/phosphoribosyl-ATP diphosphatase HisIE [Lederbergia citrea]MBS4205966.1 bifunctional phosphoribosyl-AMP cyclohydrolase/phosphoribosyl-ATP diphosphatase HisIE [Lederbergia citrea]MBS4224585.1 bifunctional phosphoribosyl-AMP cyclohydrolase/phosphoribosyl-ATP diphosphatase HisIE [Lederbergia citrea]
MKIDFSKGLIPAIIVDDHNGEVLMLAYMDETAFNKTVETKETWFYSRSREEYWNKGATSGNKQIVKSIQLDCDGDSLLIRVDPLGPACHTGENSCFFNWIEGEKQELMTSTIYKELMSEIQERKVNPVEGSYTNYLFEKGTDKIAKKLIEEAGEVIIAAKNSDKDEMINECSDLLYHCLVLLTDQGVSLNQVEEELQKRSSKKGNAKQERPEIEDW